MRFFTSDHHFFHKNILKYEAKYRPFTDVEEMNHTLIQIWNDTVAATDEVYYLGDFAFCASVEQAWSILDQLNGIKYLIKGNHDPLKLAERYFVWMKSEADIEIQHPDLEDSQTVRLCHYPYVDRDLLFMSQERVINISLAALPLAETFSGDIEQIVTQKRDYLTQRDFLIRHYGIAVHPKELVQAEPLRRYLAKSLKKFTTQRPRPDGRWLLHGHVHGLWQYKRSEKMINVSVEACSLKPISEREIQQIIWPISK